MMTSLALDLAERGVLPERFVRWGVRRLLRDRLKEQERLPAHARESFVQELSKSRSPSKPTRRTNSTTSCRRSSSRRCSGRA